MEQQSEILGTISTLILLVAQFIAVKSIITPEPWGDGGSTPTVPPLPYGVDLWHVVPSSHRLCPSAPHNTRLQVRSGEKSQPVPGRSPPQSLWKW